MESKWALISGGKYPHISETHGIKDDFAAFGADKALEGYCYRCNKLLLFDTEIKLQNW